MQESLAQQAAQAAELSQQQEQIAAAAQELAARAPAATAAARDCLQASQGACDSAHSTVAQQLGALPAALQQELAQRQEAMLQGVQKMLSSDFAELSRRLEARTQPVHAACTDSVAAIAAPLQDGSAKVAAAEQAATAAAAHLQGQVVTGAKGLQQHASALRSAAEAPHQVANAQDLASTGGDLAQNASVRTALSSVENVTNSALVRLQQTGADALQRWEAAADTLTSGALPCPVLQCVRHMGPHPHAATQGLQFALYLSCTPHASTPCGHACTRAAARLP